MAKNSIRHVRSKFPLAFGDAAIAYPATVGFPNEGLLHGDFAGRHQLLNKPQIFLLAASDSIQKLRSKLGNNPFVVFEKSLWNTAQAVPWGMPKLSSAGNPC